MRRLIHGLDDLAVETLYIGISAVVAIVVLSHALNSQAAHRFDSVPLLGGALGGLRALLGQVAN